LVKKEKGFTLVELLIALAISMVGLLGLLALQMIAIRANANSRNFSEAVGLAQEKLESLQVLPFANLVGGTTAETSLAASPGSALTIYSRNTIITTAVPLNGTTVTKLEVDVSWADTSVGGKTHTVTLVDLRTQ
jgi:prepilin-type N-terminal cleavage/methylation domain-containing protein